MPFFFQKDEIEQKIKKAFNDFGMNCEVQPVAGPKGLPLYMTLGKAFLEVRVPGLHFMLVSFVGESSVRWQSQKRILEQLEMVTRMPVALGFDVLNETQRKGLVLAKIPYVSASSFYLPFLGIAYRKQRKTPSTKNAKNRAALPKLTASAQAFFLFMMYRVKDSRISKSEAARQNSLTPMSVSRYCRELLDRGLISETRDGNTMQISCSETGRALFDKALPYLDSPIKKQVAILPVKGTKRLPKAGEVALSEMSMLAATQKDELACGPHSPLIKEKEIPSENRGFLKEHFVDLQIWKYDPLPFVREGRVDTVSLYLSLKDSPNERVQACLEEMLEKEKWSMD